MFSFIQVAFFSFSLFYFATCFKIQPKIINGVASERGQFPFYAFLRTKERSICGGTLLNDEFILSAAHCLYNTTKVEVHLGSWRKDKYERGRQVFYARSKHFFIHPDFDDVEVLNDIGLIKLPRRVVFTDSIQPVQFPNVCNVLEGMDLIAIGNGFLEYSGWPATTLQYTTLRTTIKAECKDMYRNIDESKTFCAKGLRNESICHGDSGGPAVNPINHTLYGISSFTHISHCNELPQGFTNVFPFIPWISAVTGISFQYCN